ncbi:MAG: hypothetical protein ABC542_02525 [Candidatus Methanosuratincola petrocarbonis]|nr:hypothetical protein [Candidatus Methanosuratincola sp.]
MGKIRFYKSPSCTRCPIAKFIMNRVLVTMGLEYERLVEERDTEKDSEAMAELLMLDCDKTPVIKLGSILIKEEDALVERIVREGIENWIASGMPD